MFWGARGVLVTLGVLIIGCGGENASTATVQRTQTTGSLTKAEYIKRADAICAASQKAARPLLQRFQALQQEDDEAVFRRDGSHVLRMLIEEVRHTESRIRAIPLPREDPDGAARYLDAVAAALPSFDKMADALADGDVARMRTLVEEIERSSERFEGLARDYGFKVCRGSSPVAEP